MNMKFHVFCLAALGGAASLLAPASAEAANVAYYGLCYPGTPDAQIIAATLGDIARSQGMAMIAERTGLAREALYKSLSADGNPRLTTLLSVLKAMGLRLSVTAEAAA
mgnify:CR=1 FL=1